MITKEDFIVIHSLYKKGNSISEISRLTGLDRKTIRRRLKESELLASTRRVKKLSKLSCYVEFITNFLANSETRIPSTAMYRELVPLGYTGKLTILRSFMSRYYKNRQPVNESVVRFETKAGEQMQVDWTTIRSGKTPIYAFVATLGYSRYTFVHFTSNMTAESLIACHELAFVFFKGATKTILYDNMKAVVEKRDLYGDGKHKFHSKLYDLAKMVGFTIRLCRPYRAKTKGKVERFNRYLKCNFYRALQVKLKLTNVAITCDLLNAHIFAWLAEANERLHGTIKERPRVVWQQQEIMHLIEYVKPIAKQMPTFKSSVPLLTVLPTDLQQYDKLTGVQA